MKLIPKAKPVRISIDCYHGIEHVSPNTLKNYFYIPDIEKHINDGSLRRFLDQHGISPFPEDADIYNVADLLFATEGHITDEKSMLNWWCEKEEYRNNLNLFFEEKFSAKDLSENSLDLEPFKEPRLMEFIVGFLLKKADKEASHAEIFLKIASELGSEEAKKRLKEERLKKEKMKEEERSKKKRESEKAQIISPSNNSPDKEREEFLRMKQIYLRRKTLIGPIGVRDVFHTLFDTYYDWPIWIDSQHFRFYYCYLLFILACGSDSNTPMKTLYNSGRWRIFVMIEKPSQMSKKDIGTVVKNYIYSYRLFPTHLRDDANRLLNANEQILPTVVKDALKDFFEYVETWS